MGKTNLADNQQLTFLMFSGKGGVGKTTCACAMAIYFAGQGRKTLLVSTDPAHSLTDSLGTPVGKEITPVESIDHLYAVELDAARELAVFKQKYGDVIKKIANRGTYFDEEDINEFFLLSLPGLDELMGIITLANFLKAGNFDLLVLDTAPTGHTIRLLKLPGQMHEWLRVLDLMMKKHRYLVRALVGKYVPDDTDAFLKTMAHNVKMVRQLLTDPVRTEFVPVMTPEAISICETARLLKEVKGQGIPVRRLIVNRVSFSPGCVFCRGRQNEQTEQKKEIKRQFDQEQIIEVPLFPGEICGLASLSRISKAILGFALSPAESVPGAINQNISPSPTTRSFLSWPEKEVKFVLVGGKGGVGKTTVAAATALHMAGRGRRTLIFSTDPAHSLGDSFNCRIGNRITPVEGVENLFALEINPDQMLHEFKERYIEEINEVFDSLWGNLNMDVKFDREVMTELIALTPPGLDEVMAMMKLMELADQDEYALFILDTAPTGHLIRFLELPNLARDWFKTFFKLMLKYRGIVRLNKTAELMLQMAKGVRKIQESLLDAQKSIFLPVTIPESMGLAETEDLLQALVRLGIPCRSLLINMVIPPNECNFCSQLQLQQQRHINNLRTRLKNFDFITLPLFPWQVKGVKNLLELARLLYAPV